MGSINGFPLRRYLLFAGPGRPGGGWHDFVNCFDSKDDAEVAGKIDAGTWYQVVDRELGCIVVEAEREGLWDPWSETVHSTPQRWVYDE